VQSVSVQSERIAELCRHHKDRTPLANTARGIHGIVQLTGPALSTTCGDPFDNSPPGNGVEIRQPDNNSAIFTVAIGPSASLNFAGTAYSLQFFKALVPVPTWIVDEGAPEMWLHNISKNVRELELTFFTPCLVSFAPDATGIYCATMYPAIIDPYVDGFYDVAILHMQGLRKVTLIGMEADKLTSRGRDRGMHLREVTHLGRQLKTRLRMLERNAGVRYACCTLTYVKK
jgi:hypothetical protein